MIEDENNPEIQLVKQIPSGTVEICFYATKHEEHTESDEENQNEDDDGQFDGLIKNQIRDNQQQQKANKAPHYSVDFTVYLSAKNGETISYECNTSDQQHKKLSKMDRLIYNYNGPIFSTLDEVFKPFYLQTLKRLQSGLLDYLHGFEIDNKLANIIEILSHDKEQRLYMKFLIKLDKFIG